MNRKTRNRFQRSQQFNTIKDSPEFRSYGLGLTQLCCASTAACIFIFYLLLLSIIDRNIITQEDKAAKEYKQRVSSLIDIEYNKIKSASIVSYTDTQTNKVLGVEILESISRSSGSSSSNNSSSSSSSNGSSNYGSSGSNSAPFSNTKRNIMNFNESVFNVNILDKDTMKLPLHIVSMSRRTECKGNYLLFSFLYLKLYILFFPFFSFILSKVNIIIIVYSNRNIILSFVFIIHHSSIPQ